VRKLSFLIIALLLVRYGVILLTQSDPLPVYTLRDGLILTVAGVGGPRIRLSVVGQSHLL
jgi:hypothetical protein